MALKGNVYRSYLSVNWYTWGTSLSSVDLLKASYTFNTTHSSWSSLSPHVVSAAGYARQTLTNIRLQQNGLDLDFLATGVRFPPMTVSGADAPRYAVFSASGTPAFIYDFGAAVDLVGEMLVIEHPNDGPWVRFTVNPAGVP